VICIGLCNVSANVSSQVSSDGFNTSWSNGMARSVR